MPKIIPEVVGDVVEWRSSIRLKAAQTLTITLTLTLMEVLDPTKGGPDPRGPYQVRRR